MKAIHVHLDEKLYRTVKVLCAIHGESLTVFVQKALIARSESMGLKAAPSPTGEDPTAVTAVTEV